VKWRRLQEKDENNTILTEKGFLIRVPHKEGRKNFLERVVGKWS
jgi:hypothetical protein